ncbi:helix-turn-helix domain-containing protein [Rhodopila sp.]|uniref:helix-turn-helix domain-containing protein n=1 Tax=Rhodopila sp. TaxID=2480087 RepID=UPI003D10A854
MWKYFNMRKQRSKPREWRQEQGMSLEDISTRVGIARGYISECETGVKSASAKLIRAYETLSKGQITSLSWPLYYSR